MKHCPYCKIQVGGNFNVCPLCQNQLSGEGSENIWPPQPRPKVSSRLMKTQTFCVLTAIIALFLFDFWADPFSSINWCILPILYIIIGEITFRRVLALKHSVIGTFTILAIAGIVALFLSSFWFPSLIGIIPIPLMGALIMNFVLTLTDKSEGGMVYFISSFFVGIICWIVVIVILQNELVLLWRICFLVSVSTFLGTLIFKGRSLLSEIQKRFFM